MAEWAQLGVQALQVSGVLLVEDGNHGEYRPRRDEFSSIGTAFIRAADMAQGRVLFSSASKISEVALQRIRKGIGQPWDVLLSHKGTVGKVARVGASCPPFVCSPQTTFYRSLQHEVIDPLLLFAVAPVPATAI
jgi:type I restriction enzyme S subunit